MRQLRVLTAAMLLATAMVTAAAAQTSTLRIGLAEDPDMLDPTLARTFVGRVVFASLCDKLFDIGPKLEIVPQLATAYHWSDDGKALTLALRQGVLFQDGTAMDAAAVKASLERHLTMAGSSRKSEINAVSNIEILDDHTVRLDLKTRFAPLLAQLTDRAGMILSPKAMAAEGDKFAAHPVCAGPFKFAERVAQDRIVLDRFDGYWDKDKIHFDRIVFLPITDASVRLANLQSGSLDMIERVLPTDLPQLKSDPHIKTDGITELGYQTLTINVGNGPAAKNPLGQDVRLRQALDLAIDREALTKVVFDGLYLPGNQWVSPESPYYIKEFPVQKRDLAKAQALVKESGLNPVDIDFMVPNDSTAMQVAQVVQAMAQEAGIGLKIHATEFARSFDLADKGEFGAYLIPWSGRTDPDGNVYSQFACKGVINWGRYCNADVDKALEAARQASDPAERLADYRTAEAQVIKDDPTLFLYHRRWIYAFSDKLHGFTPYPDGLIRPQGLTLQ